LNHLDLGVEARLREEPHVLGIECLGRRLGRNDSEADRRRTLRSNG
jgi:hypothetical protein